MKNMKKALNNIFLKNNFLQNFNNNNNKINNILPTNLNFFLKNKKKFFSNKINEDKINEILESKSNSNGKGNYNNNNNPYPREQMRQNNFNVLNPNPNNNQNAFNKRNYNNNNINDEYQGNFDQYKRQRVSIFRDGMTLKMSFRRVFNY